MSQPIPQTSEGRILRLHFSENDKYNSKPLREAIIAKCRDMKIAGATVFRGLEGFGDTAEIHRRHMVTHDQPIVIVIVDSAENIDRLKPVVEDMIQTGVIAVSNVQVIRLQTGKTA